MVMVMVRVMVVVRVMPASEDVPTVTTSPL